MADRGNGGRRPQKQRRHRRPSGSGLTSPPALSGVEAFGWTILAHPLFLKQIETLIDAAEAEGTDRDAHVGPNAKLLAHLLDLAFDKIPGDPGNPTFRQGGTLGEDRRHWFRAKTGNGRYRLFFRFQSAARIIVYAWVNDEQSLRTYGSSMDAYSVFAKMLNSGNPPDDFDSLVVAASRRSATDRLTAVVTRRKGKQR